MPRPRIYPPGIKKLLKLLGGEGIGNGNGFKELADYRGPRKEGALHFAAKAGLTDACKYLVEVLKLDVNAKDGSGMSPLTLSGKKGHTATSKYLLEHGAARINDNDFTALHDAAINGDCEVIKLLLDKGARVDLKNDVQFWTPLACAARNSREDAVKFLLENGANPNGQPRDYCTPLQAAIAAVSTACSTLLIEAGADVNLTARGFNPLHLAANGGIVEIINLLLQAGADPDTTIAFTYQVADRRPRKPIEVAAARGHKEAVEILFPVTQRFPSIKEWSVDGILGEMQPEGGRKKGRERGQPKSRV